ncbi:tRNA N6-adenosine threonylcarbamoyltransferase [uncultured archaeon]|nr:tRNA N6-adenosine threonylcarbamoyltransferase [uncultured archaeon]
MGKRKTICIGIEGTAHTAGVGIVDSQCRVIANEKHSHTTEKGGLIPAELARHHREHFPGIIEAAIEKAKNRTAAGGAGIGWKDVDCIAYSMGPGIGSAMAVALENAKALSLEHGLPLVPVNHCIAHIEIAKKMCGVKDPLVLYVSGGNTQVIGYDSGHYRVYGETLDIGIGNLLDSFGRELGMGFPQGPKLDEAYFGNRKYVELPYSVKGMDLSFSGLFTAAKMKIGTEGIENADLAYSLMHNAFAMALEVTERALAHTGKKELLLTGGVAASKALQKMALEMCDARGAKLKVCPQEFTTDNGAMVAWAGLLMFKAGRTVAPEKAGTEQGFRVDSEEIDWI